MKRINLRLFLLLMLMLTASAAMYAQRHTDNLNRGLVAVVPRNGQGIFLSWRIQPNEYYDVTYNVYRNNAKIASNLNVSNYFDASGNASYTYRVEAVDANGNVIEPASTNEWNNGATAKVFSTSPLPYTKPSNPFQPGYMSIPLKDIYDRNNQLVFCSCGSEAHKKNYTYYEIDQLIKDEDGKDIDATFNTLTERRSTFEQDYTPNDACLADLDGDGEVEIILKRINQSDVSTHNPKYTGTPVFKGSLYLGSAKKTYASDTKAFSIIEAYKLDGTRLWWIDCGPNMVSQNCTELNCVAYDWDEDGKAEVLMRGADNMVLHSGNCTTPQTCSCRRIGSTANTREGVSFGGEAYTFKGNEYLLYLNGLTLEPYVQMDFPLKRIETDTSRESKADPETAIQQNGTTVTLDEAGREQAAWGSGVLGHRSSKYFFGAPFLDGKKASIFLARGIYTRHKMIAYDVDKNTHQLTEKWYWYNNTPGSPWYGQGNHNFSIADVDGDGCDEIIYGSMTIDNNGKGLSTTGLGHGDAMHVGDFDPYRKGQEVFACNEDNPGSNYRDATTSEILFRHTATSDDGRALFGNFTNTVPGCVGRSDDMAYNGLLVASAKKEVVGIGAIDNKADWTKRKGFLNGRVYWDGDLLEEYYASDGTEKNVLVAKIDDERVLFTNGCNMNNASKNNPCAQGDILGDWREEFIVRSADNTELRIYTTDQPTEYRIPSLWYDHQYRQAMVWWVCAYNQPPHTSFFLGEMEGITRAPLPLTNKDRIEPTSGSDLYNEDNKGKTVMLCDNYGANTSFNIGTQNLDDNHSPALLIVNARSTVSGQNESNSTTNLAPIPTTYSTVSITGNKFGGTKMRLVKQGDGLFKMTVGTHSYGGDTEIWGGSVQLRGTLSNSKVWMNRHTQFYCAATINQPMTMEYGAEIIYPLYEKSSGTFQYFSPTIPTLNMHEGARLVLQYANEGNINITNLNIRKRDWQYGPKYNAPVFEIRPKDAIGVGTYKLGKIENITGGDIYDITPECSNTSIAHPVIYLTYDDATHDVYMVLEEGVDPNKSHTETTTTYNNVTRTYSLDFETANTEYIDGNAKTTDAMYGFTKGDAGATPATSAAVAYTTGTSGKFFHGAMGGNDQSNRALCKSFSSLFDGIVAAGETSYTFSFDMALIKSTNAGGKLTVFSGASDVLFTAEIGSTNTATIRKSDGSSFSPTINVEAYQSNKDCQPEEQYYYTFIITGSYSNGNGNVKLTVKNRQNNQNIITNEVISNTFKTIDRVNCNMPKIYGHVGFDNFTLNASSTATITTTTTTTWTEVTLSETENPKIPAGTYDKLYVTRGGLKEGYNTFCIPFNTTAEEIGGTGAVAYTLSGAKTGADNSVTLHFKKVAAMDANKPYLLKVPAQKTLPDYYENKTVSVPQSVRVVADNWQFVSNYSHKNSMNGKYLVSNNMLKYGGAKAYLNGMRAYFNPPASASNAPRFTLSFEDENGDNEATIICEIEEDDDNVEEAIYSISGIRQKSLQKGINIVRQSNGKVKKVMMK